MSFISSRSATLLNLRHLFPDLTTLAKSLCLEVVKWDTLISKTLMAIITILKHEQKRVCNWYDYHQQWTTVWLMRPTSISSKLFEGYNWLHAFGINEFWKLFCPCAKFIPIIPAVWKFDYRNTLNSHAVSSSLNITKRMTAFCSTFTKFSQMK